VFENSSHTKASEIQTSRKHMTIRNDVRDCWFDWNDCVKTCNMSKYIEYERFKILFQKIIQPIPQTPLNRTFIWFGLEGLHCTSLSNWQESQTKHSNSHVL